MVSARIIDAIRTFADWTVIALVGLLVFLVLLGLVNAVYVIFLTLRDRKARLDGGEHANAPLPNGVISLYSYLHLLADVLLVVVAVELIETLIAFLSRESPKVYLTGVLGAALVALARRIIVFFNPEAKNPHTAEMYAYAALVAALAGAYAAIQAFG